ncbi:MAG: mandelate racemase/muconate lactonizing enzyme family protein [Verrucomicrobia bacterium]|nr:mandelate racemase/muconate lactonizing enzyme family protein [Verrucomicrobiota bacterium]
MKITDVEVIPLMHPYKVAYQTANGIQPYGGKVLLKVHTDEGITGIGETCHINPDRTGEILETIAVALHRYFRPQLIGKNPFNLNDLLLTPRRFTNSKYSFQFCLSAVDCALYDIMGKAWGTPVYNLLGGLSREKISVARSIPSVPPKEMAEIAVRLKNEGYKLITFKGGFGPQNDMERLAAVRDALGLGFPLEVDFNQAYMPDVAIPLIKRMTKEYQITAVEQPGPGWDIDGMAEVRRGVDVPVIAHESVLNVTDVMEIAKRRAADVICLTLPKCAGMRNGLRMVDIADSAGMGLSVGSEHPAGPATSALRHFCAAVALVDEPIGYGAPLERFEGDIITKDLTVDNGQVSPLHGPGLGVELDEAKVEKYKAKHVVAMIEAMKQAGL